jgi:biopolymer transport protein TolR
VSSSSRARRMAQHHARHKADAELNLIPLIDILSVMVAFLLVYSTEVEVIQNPKAIQVPQSSAEIMPRKSVVVMITRDELFVQGERIASVAEIIASPTTTIAPLQAALTRPMLVDDQISTGDDLDSREITVLGDKALPYEVLKRVMTTCTSANYGRISLAVIQKEKALPAGFKPI